MAFRNLPNRPSSALRFQWDCFEQLSFIIHQCQEGRDFPEAEGVVGIKSCCNCCWALGAEVRGTSLLVLLLWTYTRLLEWHRLALVQPHWSFQQLHFPVLCREQKMQRYLLGVFILFPEDLMDLGGLCRSITVRNCCQSCYQCSRICNLKAGFQIKGFAGS